MTEPRSAEHGDGALFRGAARLGVLAGGLGLPWQELAPLVAAFPAELRDELELGVCAGTPPLWIRTRGDGKAMTFRTARFLDERGVTESALRRLLVTADHQGHHHLVFDLGLDSQGFAAWRWLLRKPLDLQATQAWLAAGGVDIDAQARVGLVAEALQRTHSHAVGERVGRGGDVHPLVVFTLSATGGSWPLLMLALERAAVSAATLARIDRLSPVLAERDTRLLIEASTAHGGLSVQLDVDGMAQDRVRALADVSEAPADAGTRLALLAPFAPRGEFDHTSVRLSGDGVQDLTAWLSTTPPEG